MKKSLLLTTFLALSTSIFASESVRINGFATVAGGQVSSSDNLSVDGYNKDDIIFQPDSLAAIQISSTIANDMTATVQMIGRFTDKSAQIDLEWAYLNYQLTEDVTAQMGRFRPAVYLYSNTLDISYSYLWIAPPSEVYSLVPMTSSDGINLLLDYTFENDMTLSASFYASNTNTKIEVAGNDLSFQFKNLMGTELVVNNDYFKLRAGYSQTEMDADLSPLGINSSSMPEPIYSALGVKDTKGTFTSVGLTVDYKNILVVGEYVIRNIEDSVFTEEVSAYYTTFGYRIGSFTPHVTYSAVENTYNKASFVTGAGVATDAVVNGTINAARSGQSTDSKTITAGLRYELNPQAALKFEYQNVNKTPLDITLIPLEEERNADLYKVALNIVF